jgi:hypothetical protein
VESTLIKIGIRVLEAIFAVGIVGSAIVVIVAGIQDLVEISKREQEESTVE